MSRPTIEDETTEKLQVSGPDQSSAEKRTPDDPDAATTFEDLLTICGDGGWWQFRVLVVTSFCGFLTAVNNIAYAFIGAIPDHWCSLPQIDELNATEIKELLIPLDESGEFERCQQYYLPWDNNGTRWTHDTLPVIDRSYTVPCSNTDFDSTMFTSTIVTEFNLVCDSQPLASLVQAIYMIGILFGSPLFGSISDKIGRRKAIIIASVIFSIAGPCVALAPNFVILMIARLTLGVASPGIYATSFVLAVEVVGPEWRGLVGNLFCLPFALGYMALPGLAYLFRNWRHLQLMLATPTLFQIIMCWIMPESPRWLLRKGKIAEAEAVLRTAAKTNRRVHQLPSEFSELVERVAGMEKDAPARDNSWIQKIQTAFSGHAQLFQTPKLRVRTLILYFCWMSIAMVYYGVALNSPNLSADRYWYTFLSGVLEIPSYLMVPPLINFLGRRIIFSAFLLLCGVCLLVSMLFQEGSTLIISLALIGKLLIGAAYALIYLYATELMPTLLRTFGVGSASMAGRIGSASAPFIVDLVGSDNKALPASVFGVLSLASGCLALFLPETKNRKLPETVDDVEKE